MAILFFIFCLCRVCFSCSAHVKFKNKEKVLEDYVVSAKFDENSALPQLGGKPSNHLTATFLKTEKRIVNNPDDLHSLSKGPDYQGIYWNGKGNNVDFPSDKYEENAISERDVAAHPATAVASAHSLLAIGFITFLILLSTLQSSLTYMIRQPALLGSLTKPPAHRGYGPGDELSLDSK